MALMDEDILLKHGPELFKEIYRIYPVAEVDDYHKGGLWRDDVMRLDLQLLLSHTREAGAAYPEPLDESKLPQLPPANPVVPNLGLGLRPPMGGVRPPMSGAVTTPGNPATIAASVAAAELRLVALFVSKWNLDAAKTKAVLDKLPTPRRRYVLQNFKSDGSDPNGSLEKYLASCEATNIWPAANALAPMTPSPVATVAPPVATVAPPVATVAPPVATVAPPAAVRPAVTVVAPRPATVTYVQPRPAGVAPQRAAGMGITMPPRAVMPPGGMTAGSVPMKRPMGMVVAAPGYDPSKRPRSVAPKAYGAVPTVVRPGLRPGLPRY